MEQLIILIPIIFIIIFILYMNIVKSTKRKITVNCPECSSLLKGVISSDEDEIYTLCICDTCGYYGKHGENRNIEASDKYKFIEWFQSRDPHSGKHNLVGAWFKKDIKEEPLKHWTDSAVWDVTKSHSGIIS